MRAWNSSNDAVSRASIALALASLPYDASSLETWKQTFTATKLDTTLPGGESALEAIAVSAPHWFHAQLVPWLGERASRAPGQGPRKADLQRSLVLAMSYLLRTEHVKVGRKVAQEFGGRIATPAFEQAATLAETCKDNADCFLSQLFTHASNGTDGIAMANKCAVALGIHGTASHRDQLLQRYSEFKDRELQESVSRTIERLTEAPDEKFLKALHARLAATSDEAELSPLALSYYRLRLRQ
jgi:hypothetical protein